MCFRKWEWCLVLELLLLPLVTGIQDYSALQVNAMTGSNITLQSCKKNLGSYRRLTWLYTTKQKILEYEDGKENVFSTYKDRVGFIPESGELHIYNVRKEDAGTYYMRVLEKIEEECQVTLSVFDPVSKPSIQVEKTEDLTNSCYMKLSCKVEDQSVNYTWYGDSGSFSWKEPGYMLEITTTPQNKSTFYTCQVSNPVSSKNDTLYFILPCHLVRSSGIRWIATWLSVMTQIIAAILLTK